MLALVEYNYRHRSLNWGLSNLDLIDNSEMPGGAWLGWEGFSNGKSKPLVPLIVIFDIIPHIRLNAGDMEHGPV
jgi:hypothetical protein